MRRDEDGLGLDAFRDKPRRASKREVAVQYNKVVTIVNVLYEELSELRHMIAVSERIEPMRQRIDPREGRM